MSKKLINSSDHCVEDMISGINFTYPGLSICTSSRIIMNIEKCKGHKTVGLISGGGSGHEPFCGGFIGKGMLNAAVAGSVFASPPTSNILTAIQNVAEYYPGGVLVLILNYTGDILNFGQAIEIARDQGINVDSLVVGDDCAMIGVEKRMVGKRGLVGMVVIVKISGALAEKGHNLEYIVQECRSVSENMATLGVCLAPCTVPGSQAPLFSIADHQMELGVGIHGEAGVLRIHQCSCREIVDVIIRKISNTLLLKSGDEVCAVVNNLGGTSQMEHFIVAGELHKQLDKAGIVVKRLYAGVLMTSIDMAGIQICIIKTNGRNDWIELLDAETEAPAWPGTKLSFEKTEFMVKHVKQENPLTGPELSVADAQILKKCLKTMCERLIESEKQLNTLDSGCGDGDCGTTLKHYAQGILDCVDSLPLNRPVSCLFEIADIASKIMGGTSGGLYSLMLRGAARHAPDWSKAWMSAIEVAKKYTSARIGHRTMMDALIPAYEGFQSKLESTGDYITALEFSVKKAEEGCESTRNMKALLGRASYVDESYWKDVDAGAYAVTVWLNGLLSALK